MNKTKESLFALSQREMEKRGRLGAIADACEAEKREMTEAEKTEVAAIKRELDALELRQRAVQTREENPTAGYNEATAKVRERLMDGRKVAIVLNRETTYVKTESVADTGIIEVAQQDMLKPLREKLIYNVVGLTVPANLPENAPLRWPSHTKATAHFADEAERLTDSKIEFGKLEAKPQRVGIAIPVTEEALKGSQGIVESVVREEMPAAVADAINEALLDITGKYTAADGTQKDRKFVGPFVAAAKTPFDFAAQYPTRKELLKMKAKVVDAGIDIRNGVYIMNETTKAELEDTKIDAGSGRFVCEDGKILGYPVFTHSKLADGVVLFGDMSYQALGLYGTMSVKADPYTLLREHAVDFVLNGHAATVTLRPEAFVVGKKKTA
jgi:HK97 family phage major capsid protein